MGGATGVVGKTTFRVDLWQVSFKRWRRFIWNYDSPICKLASLHSCHPETFRCGRIRVGGKSTEALRVKFLPGVTVTKSDLNCFLSCVND